jgi:hypothetical protein
MHLLLHRGHLSFTPCPKSLTNTQAPLSDFHICKSDVSLSTISKRRLLSRSLVALCVIAHLSEFRVIVCPFARRLFYSRLERRSAELGSKETIFRRIHSPFFLSFFPGIWFSATSSYAWPLHILSCIPGLCLVVICIPTPLLVAPYHGMWVLSMCLSVRPL